MSSPPDHDPKTDAFVPVEIRSPGAQTNPFVFASPHSGRAYSADFLNATRLDPLTLRRSEDCFVDELFAAAPALGSPLLAANFPRAYCDVNRDPAELDPAIFDEPPPPCPQTRSPRVNAGLGVIPRIVRDGADIYAARLPLAEGRRRIEKLHRPYHDALAALLGETKRRFGAAILIDCHSMPSQAVAGATTRGRTPQIVLGDRYGASCSARLVARAAASLEDLGFVVARNNPYAGGYVAETYGAPTEGVHVLQLEISRGLYLDEERIEKTAGFERLRDRLARFAAQLVTFQP